MVWLIIGIVAVVLAIIVLFLGKKEDSYRVVKVEDYKGSVALERGDSDKEIFEGINLKSGDMIKTDMEAYVLLLADSDKHLLAEENTGFPIEASGTEEQGNMTIHLEYGTALFTIDNKLNDESSFEVTTPNAALSVWGTVFRVTYDKDKMSTIVEIIEGVVEIVAENAVILGRDGENYYIDEQGLIQSVVPSEENEEGGETEEDIAQVPDNELMAPLTIMQAEFESKYMEEMIELNSENSSEYFEVIEENGTYHFVLKEGYTSYGDGYTIETNVGSAYSSAGASRYLFELLDSDNSENGIESWNATGTIVKYNIPEEMWYKVGDSC